MQSARQLPKASVATAHQNAAANDESRARQRRGRRLPAGAFWQTRGFPATCVPKAFRWWCRGWQKHRILLKNSKKKYNEQHQQPINSQIIEAAGGDACQLVTGVSAGPSLVATRASIGRLQGLEIRQGNKINNITCKSRGLPWTFGICSSLIAVCLPSGEHRCVGKGTGHDAAQGAVHWLDLAYP